MEGGIQRSWWVGGWIDGWFCCGCSCSRGRIGVADCPWVGRGGCGRDVSVAADNGKGRAEVVMGVDESVGVPDRLGSAD
jgi:hypothetical protein